jgi:eukaryotic-like serine/threonine-protein kinase
MRPGDLIRDRFEIEQLAGVGGMGEVFRARDRLTGQRVAIKTRLDRTGGKDLRFEREAQAIAELHHPGLVRYVDHGMIESGEQFLAMEWLDGEDLAQRLARERLGVNEAITLCGRVAEALAVVHARGIIHRDLKPSNLFLVEGKVDRVKILDFGIARFNEMATTQTGTVIGTLCYMAPEQARSGQEISPRSDVFALGCVIFECLTGSPAFAGQHLMAVLAKILFEQAPRVSDLRPEVPEALDRIVGRMLAKSPEDRLRDGAAVAQVIAELGDVPPLSEVSRPSPAPPLSLGGGERRLISVVLLGRPVTVAEAAGAPAESAHTLRDSGTTAADDELRRRAEVRGGRFELLADGTAVVTITGTTRIAADQAVQAARCALALRARAPDRAIALTTGQGEVTGRLPVGEVIDRAARMLLRAVTAGPGGRIEASADPPAALIAVDEVTARLLDARFEVADGAFGLELVAEREPAEGARTLLGKPTACVGRDRELAALADLFAECVDGPTAQAALVTAPPGVGKSRVASELTRLLRQRHAPLEVWVGYGDALRAGSAFALAGQALRSAAGVVDGEALEARQGKLLARVARHVPERDRRRVAEFLGEVMGIPFPDEDSPVLRAARQDAMIMTEHLELAWKDFLLAETQAHPVLLVLENLHWGDLPTVRFVDAALRDLRDRPFMVVALGRPEVHDTFPRLWSERGVTEIRLRELSAKASEKLVRQALGRQVGAGTVDRIVSLADGNAFYLEELIRTVAAGGGAELPPTVLAMVSARLEGLEGEARRVLRAASVFGEVFWKGGVGALLGGAHRATGVESWLTALAEREVLVRRQGSRFPDEREYAFRHALLREGAYAMLTAPDRALGHLLAAQWLEAAGELDPMVLAEHFERGGDPASAGRFYFRAAEQALRGNDAEAAIARAQRGLAGGVPDDVRAGLLGLLCEAHVWRGNPIAAAEHGEKVLELATPGSAAWVRAAVLKIGHSLLTDRIDELVKTLELVRSVEPAPDALDVMALALCTGIFILDLGGQFQMAELFRRRLREVVEPVAAKSPVARGWMYLADTQQIAWVAADPWRATEVGRSSRAAFLEAGHRRGALEAQVFVGMTLWRLGLHAEAERELHEAEAAERGLGLTGSLRTSCLIGVLLDRGAIAEARAVGEALVARCAGTFPANEGRARWAFAEVLRLAGDLDAADREFTSALEMLAGAPLDRAGVTAMRARLRLDQGRAAEALVDVTWALDRLTEHGASEFRNDYARLVYAEALRATGDLEGAARAIANARRHVLATADRIADPGARRSFLANVPESQRTMALAEAWLGAG